MTESLSGIFRYHKFLAAGFFGLVIWLLFRHVLDGFWQGDDSIILLHALRHPLVDIFIDPASWQALSQVNLTPWLSLSFFVDYTLAGMNPEFFYWHQLIALLLVCVASYLLLSLFVHKSWAFAGSLVFLFGAPVASVAGQLMTRHYVEGLLFALLSLYFFFRYRDKHAKLFLIASVAFYILAITAKEIYVPLVFLFLLLSWTGRAERPWQSMYFVAVLLLYMAWRNYMLPGLADGYAMNDGYFTPDFWLKVFSSLLGIPGLILGVYTAPVLVLFTLLTVGAAVKAPGTCVLFLICAALVCGPLIPLIYFPGLVLPDRYVLLPWYLFCFAVAVFTNTVAGSPENQSRTKVAIVLGVWGLLCLFASRARRDYLDNIEGFFETVETQMRFFWTDQSVAFIPTPEVSNALVMLPAMKALRLIENAEAAIPEPLVDDKLLVSDAAVFSYSAACKCMVDITAEISGRLQRFAEAQQSERPLSLDISNEDGLMSWNFGPYDEGVYTMVIEEMGSTPLPKQQQKFRTWIRDGIDFYLRYDAPEGWVTYSSLLHLEPNGGVVRWTRD